MKNTLIISTIVLLATLGFTNPTQEDFQKYVTLNGNNYDGTKMGRKFYYLICSEYISKETIDIYRSWTKDTLVQANILTEDSLIESAWKKITPTKVRYTVKVHRNTYFIGIFKNFYKTGEAITDSTVYWEILDDKGRWINRK